MHNFKNYQTALRLSAFHSLVNYFAGKQTSFSVLPYHTFIYVFCSTMGYYEKYYTLPCKSSMLKTYYLFNLGFLGANKETGNVKGVSFHN